MSLRTLLFDYGGTLDAPGVPWVERFLQIYADEGVSEPEERIRAAFGHATRCAYADRQIAAFGLDETVAFHVDHQLQFLDRSDPTLEAVLTGRFVHASRVDLATSRAVLERLGQRFTLGVISNFYGNVHVLLDEAGFTPLLSAIVDSNRVGVSKPAEAIFLMAVEQAGCPPQDAMYVGDSFEKDVIGAHAAGLQTAWLVGASTRECLDPALVDVRLQTLAELENYLR